MGLYLNIHLKKPIKFQLKLGTLKAPDLSISLFLALFRALFRPERAENWEVFSERGWLKLIRSFWGSLMLYDDGKEEVEGPKLGVGLEKEKISLKFNPLPLGLSYTKKNSIVPAVKKRSLGITKSPVITAYILLWILTKIKLMPSSMML
ncbi:hypothetical protein AMTRI_Chr09g38800 [Amborella trichopoda]